MTLDFEYGSGLLRAQLPEYTDVFIPGETVPDPPCLPQTWECLYEATRDSVRHPIGMPPLASLARRGSRVVLIIPDIVKGGLQETSHRKVAARVCLDELKIAVCVKGASIKTVLLEPESRIRPPATISDIQWLDMSSWHEVYTSGEENFEQWYREKFDELCSVIESDDSAELGGDIQMLKNLLHPYLNTEKEYGLLSKEFYGRRWLEDYIEKWQDKNSFQ